MSMSTLKPTCECFPSLHVALLRGINVGGRNKVAMAAPKATDVEALQAAVQGPEIVRSHGRQLYLVYPEGIGRSKLTNTLIERKLGTRGTGRNWNTVLKLAALIDAGRGPKALTKMKREDAQ
jgi:uncharacterized protein (DUF1697 family)